MSLLAEPRRKQKISVDPNGKAWLDSSAKVGKRLMEGMGWREGSGLGRQLQGHTDPLRPKANSDGRGLGSKHSSDQAWLTHQDNFSALLKTLNAAEKSKDPPAGEAPAERSSLEARSKKSRARIHYHKYARMKDAGAYSKEDMGSILGKRMRKPKVEPVKEEPKDEIEEPASLTVSTLSASDYYAQAMREKLARLKAAGSLSSVPAAQDSVKEEEEPSAKQKKKKKKSKRSRSPTSA